MTLTTSKGLQDLEREYPEWKPWLAVVAEVLEETANGKWEASVPAALEARPGKAPFLAGATLAFDAASICGWAERLFHVAHGGRAGNMAGLNAAKYSAIDPVALFAAALHLDGDRLGAMADQLGVDRDGFQAVAVLVPVPFLNSCNRRWTAISNPDGWTEGYCPVCGAWPALAEIRGIERSRHLRCARCGSQWETHCLLCPFCGMTDHKELASLLPEKNSAGYAVDVCRRCLGYIKTFTRLQGSPPEKILLDDLASVDLDVAALEQGYKRPAGSGYALNSQTIAKPTLSERIFRWNT